MQTLHGHLENIGEHDPVLRPRASLEDLGDLAAALTVAAARQVAAVEPDAGGARQVPHSAGRMWVVADLLRDHIDRRHILRLFT